jgi:hypothetical protein
MAFPLKDDFKQGQSLAVVSHEWLNTVARIFNTIDGVEKTYSGFGWSVIQSDSDATLATDVLADSESLFYRGRPRVNKDDFATVDIEPISWYQGNDPAVSDSAAGLGSSTNPYIVAALDTDVSPTTLTLTADTSLPADSQATYKQLVATLTYDGGSLAEVRRATLGDIHRASVESDNTDVLVAVDSGATAGYLGANDSDGVLRTDTTISYTDGGSFVTLGVATTTATVVTDVQYDTTTHQIQKKTRTLTVISGGTESGWTLITGGQAAACP